MAVEDLTVKATYMKRYDELTQLYNDIIADVPSSFLPKKEGNKIEDELNYLSLIEDIKSEKYDEIVDWKKTKSKEMAEKHTDNEFEEVYNNINRIEKKTSKIRNTVMITFMVITFFGFALFFSLFAVSPSKQVAYMIVWILLLCLLIAEIMTFVIEWIRHHYTANPKELITKAYWIRKNGFYTYK